MTYKDKAAAIARQFRQAIEDKYNVIEMKLFGSCARGDNTMIYQNIQKEGIAI